MPVSDKSLANLTPWKPGKSANPGGVPKGKRISTWLAELGDMDVLPDAATLPVNGRIALARIKKAMTDKGERSAEFIANLTEDKKPQTYIHSEPIAPTLADKLATYGDPDHANA